MEHEQLGGHLFELSGAEGKLQLFWEPLDPGAFEVDRRKVELWSGEGIGRFQTSPLAQLFGNISN